MQITFFTDGSSKGNPGPGGWGVYLEIESENHQEKNHEHKKLLKKILKKTISGGQRLATNNQMELMAGIKALEYLKENLEKIIENLKGRAEKKEGLKIKIKTDSQYLKNGIETWSKTWEKNNWQTSRKKEVLNKNLWQNFLELKNFINKKLLLANYEAIRFEYVRAHIGTLGNEMADRLAKKAADNFMNLDRSTR